MGQIAALDLPWRRALPPPCYADRQTGKFPPTRRVLPIKLNQLRKCSHMHRTRLLYVTHLVFVCDAGQRSLHLAHGEKWRERVPQEDTETFRLIRQAEVAVWVYVISARLVWPTSVSVHAEAHVPTLKLMKVHQCVRQSCECAGGC